MTTPSFKKPVVAQARGHIRSRSPLKDGQEKPTPDKAGDRTKTDYNPTARDFQRTEEDTDAVSKSEKENANANKRTEEGNTTPDKNKIS
jgi:hypothetical protein